MSNLQNTRAWGIAAVGLAALVAVALVMPACGGGAKEQAGAGTGAPATDEQAANMPPTTITVEMLRSNPNDYYQKPVIVTGVVGQTVAPGAFLLAPSPGAQAGESVLVATRNMPADLTAGTPVRVTGTPRPFDFNTFNTQIGQNWNKAAFTQYNNQPAILATSVEVMGAGEAGAGGAAAPGVPGNSGGAGGGGTRGTPPRQ